MSLSPRRRWALTRLRIMRAQTSAAGHGSRSAAAVSWCRARHSSWHACPGAAPRRDGAEGGDGSCDANKLQALLQPLGSVH